MGVFMGFKGDCMGCEKRYPGCHSKCESYLNAKAEYEKEKALVKDEMDYKKYAHDRTAQFSNDRIKMKKKHKGYARLKGH